MNADKRRGVRIMKIVRSGLWSVMFLMIAARVAAACEIEVKVVGEQKPVYRIGDIVILEVLVFLTHRDCPKGIKSTEFKGEGIKLLGAKEWKQVTPERFSRILKAEIVSAEHGEATLHVRRSCEKEGGHGLVKVKVQ